MATGLVEYKSKEPWPAPPSKVVLDRWAEGCALLQRIRERRPQSIHGGTGCAAGPKNRIVFAWRHKQNSL